MPRGSRRRVTDVSRRHCPAVHAQSGAVPARPRVAGTSAGVVRGMRTSAQMTMATLGRMLRSRSQTQIS